MEIRFLLKQKQKLETKTKIEEGLEELKKAKEEKDVTKIDSAKNNLMQHLQAIYQAMQQQQKDGSCDCNNDNCNCRQNESTDNDAKTEEASYEEVK